VEDAFITMSPGRSTQAPGKADVTDWGGEVTRRQEEAKAGLWG
jgi:hypothetical protein